MSIKIMIVDDHSITREGLKALLEKRSEMQVVAEAENGRIAVKLARKLKPDIIVMDINMPDLNGIEATRQIISESPDAKVVALSMYSDKSYVKGMLKAGVSGYVMKNCAFEELIHAILTVMKNQTYLSPRISDIVRQEFVSMLESEDTSPISVLTEKECEVLQLIAEGVKTREIASRINISVKTVEARRRQIMEKLKIDNIAELTKFAVREGLTSL